MSRKRDVFDIDKDIEIGMNLAALRWSLKLCREERLYVDIKTLASVIHHVLQDDTDMLIRDLSALVAKGKRERD
jgi:hypothetical protein